MLLMHADRASIFYYKQCSNEQLFIFCFIYFYGNKFPKVEFLGQNINVILIELAFQRSCFNLHLYQQCTWMLDSSHSSSHGMGNV